MGMNPIQNKSIGKRLSVNATRKLLGNESEKYSDDELRAVLIMFEVLADIFIDSMVANKK